MRPDWLRRRRRPGGQRRSLPMFMRVFGALAASVIAISWAFGSLFTAYQDRTTADTLAPLWAEAIRAPEGAASALRTARKVEIPVEVLSGEPPKTAAELTNEGRMKAIAWALAARGIDVQQIRLDDAVDPPVTWLRVARGGGTSRWVGMVGGLQPSEYRRRLALALGALVLIVVVVTVFVSRWVAAPLSRLVGQVDAIARGDLPDEPVRGAREIERLGDALGAMAQRHVADEAERRAMLLGVSHDLRSPLARIRVAAELLEGQNAKLRDLIVRNVVQADAMIESFLTYVRAEGETADEDVDLARVGRLAAELAQLAPERTDATASVPVRGNATLLHRLVANLIDNAQRHGAPPVELSVDSDTARGEAVLTVSDAGTGIADAERLRRPFERGDAARSAQGAGLGLAIVDRIAERHGGRVEIARNARGGASVSVRLPLA